jgi:hypothetical protein
VVTEDEGEPLKKPPEKMLNLNVRPPNRPWQPIPQSTTNDAILTFYYSDSQSPVPIRDVSSRSDPKPDPNVETLTYGLFSGCCKKARRKMVEQGIENQFFCTSRLDGIRVLTGYYRPAWYAKISDNDYAIAAKSGRFISPGYVLSHLINFLDGYPIDRFFRGSKAIPEEVAEKLLLLVNSAPDVTSRYVSEIKRLERYSLEKYGYMYSDLTEGFSWEYAADLMKKWSLV